MYEELNGCSTYRKYFDLKQKRMKKISSTNDFMILMKNCVDIESLLRVKVLLPLRKNC